MQVVWHAVQQKACISIRIIIIMMIMIIRTVIIIAILLLVCQPMLGTY